MMICVTLLTGGCFRHVEEVPPPGPQFCDVEEARRFTQEELDWRAEHAPWNLRRDFKTNATYDRECAAQAQEQ